MTLKGHLKMTPEQAARTEANREKRFAGFVIAYLKQLAHAPVLLPYEYEDVIACYYRGMGPAEVAGKLADIRVKEQDASIAAYDADRQIKP